MSEKELARRNRKKFVTKLIVLVVSLFMMGLFIAGGREADSEGGWNIAVGVVCFIFAGATAMSLWESLGK